MVSISTSALAAENGAYLEEQQRLYQKDPLLFDPHWRAFFELLNVEPPRPSSPPTVPVAEAPSLPSFQLNQAFDGQVEQLVHAYRSYGYLAARFDPFDDKEDVSPNETLSNETLSNETVSNKTTLPPMLQSAQYGLEPGPQLSASLVASHGLSDAPRIAFSELLQRLQQLYCGVVGYEYMGLENPDMESFIQEHIESTREHTPPSLEKKQHILHQLNRSELFERFLHQHYTGQKRFSLEGGETLIPMLHELIEEASGLGYSEFIIGMAHRGRLNVLANVLEKPYREIFSEFEEDSKLDAQGSGDVKYHKGFSTQRESEQGLTVKMTLCPNPSHLESVYPVVEGMARARCIQLGGSDNGAKASKQVLPIVLHGDGALAGQGVVYETLQMAHLKGYESGGTLHVVINNQIGFTTPPSQARSTRYCTDLARSFGIPVFHLNAEYPEECLFATHLALLLRHQFGCDVFLDLNCYRKYGHNETDEPAFTQPTQAQWIRKRPSIRDLYRQQLHKEGLDHTVIDLSEKHCEEALKQAFEQRKEKPDAPLSLTTPLSPTQHPSDTSSDTAVKKDQLLALAESCCRIPDAFQLHPKLQQLYKTRLQMARGELPCDWGMAELLAMAVILSEGVDVRLSGQDCARGTFSHRHALLVDQKNEQEYYPLAHIAPQGQTQGRFEVYNSPLSEYAVLGFEFGYSAANPEACVFWEAQFGDFANGGQIIIDQYIAAAEQKWGLSFDLILLLPHGYEGQGPEHSSARLERFLALCGNDNLYVTHPTTPSQLFHLLRRQQKSTFHKPLVLLTPKGLLRHPDCVSTIQEIAEGSFQEVLTEELVEGVETVETVETLVLCTGRFYYDLRAERAKRYPERPQEKMALIRVEQLYPLPTALQFILTRYTHVTRYVWAQEEPQNMGAWSYIEPCLRKLVPGREWDYVGRLRSASPAVGSYARHRLEHKQLMDALFVHKER